MTKDEALRLALEALENWFEFDPENFGEIDKKAITAIKAALEAKGEPWVCECKADSYFACKCAIKSSPQRKPLTDEEIEKMRHLIDWTAHWSYNTFARAIEAAHGIKENT